MAESREKRKAREVVPSGVTRLYRNWATIWQTGIDSRMPVCRRKYTDET